MKPRDFVVLSLAFAAALTVRTVFIHRQVFLDGQVRFLATDPWYHVRLAENTAAHFPHVVAVDPYLSRQGSHEVPVAPLLAWLIAGIGLIIGDPARVAVWLPPIVGAATVIPVFFLARALWGERGWIAPFVYAVLPGQTLQRSLLGYSDHHVLEMCFSTCAMLYFIRALPDLDVAPDSAGGGRRLKPAPHQTLRRFPILDCVLGGLALFVYLVAWGSGIFFVAVLAACAVITALVRRDRQPLRIAALLFGAAALPLLIVAIGVPVTRRQLVGTVAAAIALGACDFVLEWAFRQKRPVAAAIGVLTGVGAAGAAALAIMQPQFVQRVAEGLQRFNPGAGALFVGEVRPMTALARPFQYLWTETGLVWIFTILALIVLGREVVMLRSPRHTALLVWVAIMSIASFAQIRFLYYFGIAASVLVIVLVVKRSTAAAIVFAAILVAPCVSVARQTAARFDGPSLAWLDALEWIRGNTPEPFGDPHFWFENYDRLPADRTAQSTVMAWWDFGYWIMRNAHRVPVANPTQTGVVEAARFYTAQNEDDADRIAASLKVDTVIADDSLPVARASSARVRSSGAMPAMAAWAGETMERYFERVEYRDPAAGRNREAIVFYPEYFRTMAVRMSVFGGAAVKENASYVAAIARGKGPPRIVELRRFPSFEEASRYAGAAPNRRVVSVDPIAPCIPLEPLRRYKRVRDVVRSSSFGRSVVRVYRRIP